LIFSESLADGNFVGQFYDFSIVNIDQIVHIFTANEMHLLLFLSLVAFSSSTSTYSFFNNASFAVDVDCRVLGKSCWSTTIGSQDRELISGGVHGDACINNIDHFNFTHNAQSCSITYPNIDQIDPNTNQQIIAATGILIGEKYGTLCIESANPVTLVTGVSLSAKTTCPCNTEFKKPQGSWDTLSKLVATGGFNWSAKKYIASCGRFTIWCEPYGDCHRHDTTMYIQWAWVHTKGTYVIHPDRTSFAADCSGGLERTTAFLESEYRIITGITHCEAGMKVNNNPELFRRCVSNLFNSRQVQPPCSECFSGTCPTWRCF